MNSDRARGLTVAGGLYVIVGLGAVLWFADGNHVRRCSIAVIGQISPRGWRPVLTPIFVVDAR